ncbi:MAG: hypothetical protein HFF87_06910 [Oscillibacter sp.]|jgi:hypothetical protein|nr:hypothetical protein [Oscillibacter sp.]MCI9481052.1 hypothetical protein [Oscillibacter sp.]
MYELTAGTVIENGAEASCILARCKGIQFVSVTFCGKMPESWTALGDDGCNWAALPAAATKAMAADLGTAIRKGHVENVWISFEPWGEDYMLNADFENGWAALLYNAIDESAAALYVPRPDGAEDAPVSIGGQTPVPKMCAADDLDQAAEALVCFLETGQFHPEMQWAVLEGNDLPWTET